VSRRLAFLARGIGILGILVGTGLVLASWAVALPSYEVARVVVPQLVFSEPLIWFGMALLFTPTLARLIAESRATGGADDDHYASAAYVTCPECAQLVRVSLHRCPYCGEDLTGKAARLASSRQIIPNTAPPK